MVSSIPTARHTQPRARPSADRTNGQDDPASSLYEPLAIQRFATTIFRVDKLYPHQHEAIEAALLKGDVFLDISTGLGKSLCYHLPAIWKSWKAGNDRFGKVTVVVVSTRDLMCQQVKKLAERGIDSVILTDKSKGKKYDDLVMARLLTGGKGRRPCLVYTSPEKLSTKSIKEVLSYLKGKNALERIVIDEGHNLVENLRYRREDLGRIRKLLGPEIPITVGTGSSTEEMRQEIATRLGLVNPITVTAKSKHSHVEHEFVDSLKKSQKLYEEIAKIIKVRFPGQAGLVFVRRRDGAEELAEVLKRSGVRAGYCHADMGPQRQSVLARWLDGHLDVLCATNCLAEGIDHTAARFVIQLHLPSTMTEYHQKVGRAGRDGDAAICMLYINLSSIQTDMAIISASNSKEAELRYNEVAKFALRKLEKDPDEVFAPNKLLEIVFREVERVRKDSAKSNVTLNEVAESLADRNFLEKEKGKGAFTTQIRRLLLFLVAEQLVVLKSMRRSPQHNTNAYFADFNQPPADHAKTISYPLPAIVKERLGGVFENDTSGHLPTPSSSPPTQTAVSKEFDRMRLTFEEICSLKKILKGNKRELEDLNLKDLESFGRKRRRFDRA